MTPREKVVDIVEPVERTDAVVVGAGPNGLAAALTLARAGLGVEVFEGASSVGGGTRTEFLTLEAFRHDVCSAVHPLLVVSPFFRSLDLGALGIVLRQPEVAFAHTLLAGGPRRCSVRWTRRRRTWAATRRRTGRWSDRWSTGSSSSCRTCSGRCARSGPIRSSSSVSPPQACARRVTPCVGSRPMPVERSSPGRPHTPYNPWTRPLTAAFGLLLTALGHVVGWPVVEGGSGAIGTGLVAEIERWGGVVHTGRPVRSLNDLPRARAVLLDVSPRQFLSLAGDALSGPARRPWARYVPGPGACKVDWALDGPVPWSAEACRRTVTVHVGGTFDEVARSEAEVGEGRHPERPFVLVAQPCVVDPTRAPDGRHTLWGYCHVPNGSDADMSDRMEAQIERFAPGFRDRVLARAVRPAGEAEAHNPNLLGGDVNGGAATLRQTLFRPVVRWNPYRTPLDGVYLCSASTPPGGGVHGMCGQLAAEVALKERFGSSRNATGRSRRVW